MPESRLIERIWWGRGAGARVARAALRPLSAGYGAAVRVRGALYDAGLLARHSLPLPAVSVGNLSVGGTGKTPVASWVATRLRDEGAVPAILLRGYGGDEPLVHERLAPGIPVVVGADRVEAAGRAVAMGADALVLDDAFQHRRAARDVDLVLVSAERWTGEVRVLPAGPWREPLSALQRASMVLVTRKSASPETAATVADALAARVPGVPVGTIALLADTIVRCGTDEHRPLSTLAGSSVLAIAAIGDPGSFFRQLEQQGIAAETAVFPDHHAFSAVDIGRLAARAERTALAICTLKDAVKLAPGWPRQAPPLWYVSQRVSVERGAGVLAALLDRIHHARRARPRGAELSQTRRPLS